MKNDVVLRAIAAVAEAAHEDWRKGFNAKNPGGERFRATSDKAWAKRMAKSKLLKQEGGQVKVNINTDFANLPDDWGLNGENGRSAEAAVLIVLVADQTGRPLCEAPNLEWAAALQHDAWRVRRVEERKAKLVDGEYQPADGLDEGERNWIAPLLVDYAELPEDEKEKDREWIRLAVQNLG